MTAKEASCLLARKIRTAPSPTPPQPRLEPLSVSANRSVTPKRGRRPPRAQFNRVFRIGYAMRKTLSIYLIAGRLPLKPSPFAQPIFRVFHRKALNFNQRGWDLSLSNSFCDDGDFGG